MTEQEKNTKKVRAKWTNRFDKKEYEESKDEEINFEEILNTEFESSLSNFFASIYSIGNIADLFDCSRQHITNLEGRENVPDDKKINIFWISGQKFYLFDRNICNNFTNTVLSRKRLTQAMKRHKKRLKKIADGVIVIGNEK